MANHKDTARPPTGEDLARDLLDLGVALNKAAAMGLGTPVDLPGQLPKPILVEVEHDGDEPDEDAPDEYGREDLARREGED